MRLIKDLDGTQGFLKQRIVDKHNLVLLDKQFKGYDVYFIKGTNIFLSQVDFLNNKDMSAIKQYFVFLFDNGIIKGSVFVTHELLSKGGLTLMQYLGAQTFYAMAQKQIKENDKPKFLRSKHKNS